MALKLDSFVIGFSSEELKEFEQALKKTEKQLDETEKDIKNLEKELRDIEKQGGKDSKTFKDVEQRLKETKSQAKLLSKELDTLKGSGKYSALTLQKNFTTLAKTFAKLAFVGIAVKKSLDFYEQAEQLDFLAQKSGVATEKLQALSNVAKRYGGTTEGTAGTLENLRSQYQSLRMGEGGGGLERAAFKYGVSISSDPEQMLENVARRMETLKSDAAKWDLANTLGIDEGTARMLMGGLEKYRAELKRIQKYKLYTKEDIERMREYRQVQQDIRMGVESIFGSIYRSLLPAIMAVSKAIRAVTDWLAEHEGAVKIIATMAVVALAIGAVTSSVKVLNIAFKALLANPVALTMLGWAALITIVITVIQDFITWLQGGESAMQGLWEMGAKIFNGLKTLATGFIDTLKSLWDNIPDPIKKFLTMTNPIGATFTTVTMAKDAISKANNNELNPVPAGSVANYNSTKSISSTNSNKNVNIGQVTINTQATNGKEIANEMATLSQADNGFVA